MRIGISHSLRLKILLPLAFVMMAVGALSAIHFGRRLDSALVEEFSSKGKALAKSLASSAQDTLLTRDVSTVQGFIDEYKGIRGVGYVYVLDGKGAVLAHTFSPVFPDEFLAPGREQADSSKITETEVSWRGRHILDIQAPILAGSLGYAHVGMDLDLARSIRSEAVRNVLLSVLLLSIVGFGFIFWLLNNSIRQIIYLSSLSRQVSEGNLNLKEGQWSQRYFGTDEIGVLALNFFKMIIDLKFQRENLERAVTERTKELLESQKVIVEQQQSMMAASKMSSLGMMAGGVAHEINNPLGIIKLVTSQIQDLHNEVPFNKTLAEEMTTKVIKTTDRIAKIVNGLRTFSRDGSMDSIEEVNLRSFVEDTLGLCMERMRNHGVQFSADPIDEKLAFQGRGTEISQVLVNLLNNADDAIGKLPEKWIKLSVQSNAEWLEIRVTDSGNGIPPEVQKKLFQPFFTTKEIGKGTGLGLSISHGIVKNHGGELTIDSSSPNTCFLVRLPAHKLAKVKSKRVA